MMRAGGTRGTMDQCLTELHDIELPAAFKLTQVRSLLRYLREVGSLVTHVKGESGFDCDTTAYLEILCAKEDSNLLRRVSDTRILKQVRMLRLVVTDYNTSYLVVVDRVRVIRSELGLAKRLPAFFFHTLRRLRLSQQQL